MPGGIRFGTTLDLKLSAPVWSMRWMLCAGLLKEGPTSAALKTSSVPSCAKVSPRAAELARLMPVKQRPDLSRFLLSPMPGLLVSLAVRSGEDVKAGQELAVVEAMKMENLLRAERDGKVAKLHAQPGDSLAVDQAILEFE